MYLFFSVVQGQEVPFEEPLHPRKLQELNVSSYDSLIGHGAANLLYGRYIDCVTAKHYSV